MSNETNPKTSTNHSDKVPEQRSQLEEVWRNFKHNRLSLVGGILVLAIILVAILSPVLAPHDPIQQYHPSPESGLHNPVPPGTSFEDSGTNEKVTFLLGTDNLGRDLLSRSLVGTRVLFATVISIIALAVLLAIPIGAISGFYANTWLDSVLMRLMDVVLSFPSLVLAIAVIGVFGTSPIDIGILKITNQIKVIIVVAIVYVPRLARVMRSSIINEMEEEYVDAVVASGANSRYILTQEVFPNTLSPVIVQATLLMATAILSVAGLSFLGIGIQPPRPGLGTILANSRDYIYSGAWWFSIVPGIVIMIMIFGFNLLGDGLRDALDTENTEQRRR